MRKHHISVPDKYGEKLNLQEKEVMEDFEGEVNRLFSWGLRTRGRDCPVSQPRIGQHSPQVDANSTQGGRMVRNLAFLPSIRGRARLTLLLPSPPWTSDE